MQQLKSGKKPRTQTVHIIILSLILLIRIESKCAYKVQTDGRAIHVEDDPHQIQGLNYCVQYNQKYGCCDINNDNSQINSYKQIDGVFGSQGNGCDICAINLKRFWCQYACSPRQSQFMTTSKQFYPYPSPKDPTKEVMVQIVNLTVHADSACALYNSCKRISFVTSVSAMSSPAGFLNFQGHNAIDDAYQYINVRFSYSKNDSLYFSDDAKQKEPERAAFQLCNFTSGPKSKVHGFDFLQNCTCNNCEDSCNNNGGFQYKEASVLEDFNWILVTSVWAGVLLIAGGVTFYRNRAQKEKQL